MDIEEALHSTKSDTKGYENHNKHRGFGKPAQASEQLVAIAGTAGTWDHKSEYARIGLDKLSSLFYETNSLKQAPFLIDNKLKKSSTYLNLPCISPLLLFKFYSELSTIH